MLAYSQASPSPRQAHPHLRVVGEEESPSYDADPPTAREAFAMIPASAFDRLKGDGFALAVYAALAKYADRDGACWPKVDTLCELVGWSKPTVIKALRKLREVGLIESETRWSKGSVTANAYRLTMHPPVNHVDSTGKARLPVEGSAGQPDLLAPVNVVDSTGKARLPKLDPRELDTEEQEGETPLPPATKSKPKKPEPFLDGFDDFYRQYPKHKDRPGAERAWSNLKPDADLRAEILRTVAAHRTSWDWRKEGGRFIPYPATWLNRRGWEDDVGSADPPASMNGRAGRAEAAIDFFIRTGKGER